MIRWAVGAAVVLLIIGLIAAGARRASTSALREHFGKEYDRTVREAKDLKMRHYCVT